MNTTTAIAAKPIEQLKNVLSNESVKGQFTKALKEKADLFSASIVELYSGDEYLQKCDPKQVALAALKAATFDLPINKNLGFAYIIPYYDGKSKQYRPQFQLGYKGLLQLALRSGEYKCINAGVVYEGELQNYSRLTGGFDLDGARKSDLVIGYFAYIETKHGFCKSSYWSVDDVKRHASRFSQTYKRDSKSGVWGDNFDAMAIKTVLKNLISKYGVMSIDFAKSVENEIESDVEVSVDGEVLSETLSIEESPAVQTTVETEASDELPQRDFD